jgi:hypothetical protein
LQASDDAPAQAAPLVAPFAAAADGAVAEPFDRAPGYDPSWLRYAEVDIYGQSLERAP